MILRFALCVLVIALTTTLAHRTRAFLLTAHCGRHSIVLSRRAPGTVICS